MRRSALIKSTIAPIKTDMLRSHVFLEREEVAIARVEINHMPTMNNFRKKIQSERTALREYAHVDMSDFS